MLRALAAVAVLLAWRPAKASDRCTGAYANAYMSTLTGQCAQPAQCTNACQRQIDDVLNLCAGVKTNDTDPITGLVAERSFVQEAMEALQTTGQVDCEYRVGHARCDDGCNMGNITGGVSVTTKFEQHRCIAVDPATHQSATLAAWHSCEGVCRAEFEQLVNSCGGCSDPVLAHFLADAGSKLMMCVTGNHGQNGCAAMADGLDSACCAGPDGIVGNDDDSCSIKHGHMPTICSDDPVCAAAVKTAAIGWCPQQFTTSSSLLGLFLDCGGNLQQLLAAEPVHTKAAIYCDATHDHGIALPGSYDSGGRRALQGAPEVVGPPPEASSECLASYQVAFDAAVGGDCAAPHCTFNCQLKISQMLTACGGDFESSRDSATNMTIRTPFTAKAVAALQLLMPEDCAYSGGYQTCASECSIVQIAKELNGLDADDDIQCATFFMGVDFHSWQGCGTPPTVAGGEWIDAPQSTKDTCWARYVNLVSRCGGCSDPYVTQFFRKSATATANKHCENCTDPQKIAEKIREMCCVGGEGTESDLCSTVTETFVDSGGGGSTGPMADVTWYVPNSCLHGSACQAYVLEIAEHACPSLFLADGYGDATTGGAVLGMYDSCGGNATTLLSQGAPCQAPAVPEHAHPGTCSSAGVRSGERCEMTCKTGYCITGRQPQCYDGHLVNTMQCQLQHVDTCHFPPNGGCDRLTTCSEDTSLFGTRLIQCSSCPPGYYGSGRSGCQDVDECEIASNGGCDEHTTCTNTDGGYRCSACSTAAVNGIALTGDPYQAGGCHLPTIPEPEPEPEPQPAGLPKCTDMHEFSNLMNDVETVCCYGATSCASGFPEACNDACGAVVLPMKAACQQLLSGPLWRPQWDAIDEFAAQCKPPPSCTDLTELQELMNDVEHACCTDAAICASGFPSVCSAPCSLVLPPMARACASLLDGPLWAAQRVAIDQSAARCDAGGGASSRASPLSNTERAGAHLYDV